jgi:YHS domain-containing protein
MISLRNRRATILPSTLIFALTCHAGLLSAQSPEAWPFDDNEHAPATQNGATPQPKSAVQLKLEELYRRDGRPMPDYIKDGGSPKVGNQAAPQQQASQLPARTAQAPVPMQASPAAATQTQSSTGSRESLWQQLSDYYGSQGKTMPQRPPSQSWNAADTPRQSWNAADTPRQSWNAADRPQPSWNAAERPQPSVAAANAGQMSPSGPSAASAPQPRLIDRINPFSHFWKKDDAGNVPPSTAVTSGNASSQATTAPNRGSSWGQTAATPVRPSVKPTVVPAPAKPVPHYMTVELGPSAPISSISRPMSVPTHPMSPSPQPSVASRSTQTTTADVTAKVAVRSSPASAAVTQMPSDLPHSTAPIPEDGSSKVAGTHDATPFNAKAETKADKKSAPYTGLTLQDEQDGVTAPDPTKITTANANEPADRPPAAPMPAVDLEQPKKTVEQSNAPAPQPSVAGQPAPPAPSAAPAQPEANHLTQDSPDKPHMPADSSAPKAFNERQSPAQPIHRPEDIAAKMHKIGERVAQKGLKGFCPVVLREQRDLVDAVPVYSSVYESKRYYFSSAEAQARFEHCPQKYAPIAGGIDVVVKATSDQAVEGTLDFAAWYKDRLFLFTSPESLEAFSLNPLPYAGPYLRTH